METLPLTLGRVVSIWWANSWRGAIVAAIPQVPWSLPFLVNRSFYHQWNHAVQIAFLGWDALVWIWATQQSLQKTYSEFRIVLVPRDFKL